MVFGNFQKSQYTFEVFGNFYKKKTLKRWYTEQEIERK